MPAIVRRDRRNRGFLLIVFLFACAITVPGQDVQAQDVESISTERPAVGASPDLISPGSLQVESGVGITFTKNQYAADLPESLIRYGFTRRLEGRLQMSDAIYQPGQAPGIKLFQTADTAVSAKFLLGGLDTIAPKAGILNLSLPTGGLQYTSGSYDPSLTFVWVQAITHGYFIGEVAQGTLTTLYGARRPAWEPSVAVSHPFSDRLSAYAEYAPSLLQDRSLMYVVDGGLALVHNKIRQFDVRTGYVKDSHGFHALIGFGYSVRYGSFFSGPRYWPALK